jgi:UDP-2,3-diacylglucosamine hydrolase
MEIRVPPHWRTIDFVSDLHLQASAPLTYQAWSHYLRSTSADAVFILGDFFEVWVGDDILNDPDSFEAQCCQLLKKASARLEIFVMHGNRDFLMGEHCMAVCHATLLDDPCTLQTAHQRWLLTHGDALCIADTSYIDFRKKVRNAAWQGAFLAKPLAERQEIARQLRQQSEQRKSETAKFADVDTPLALQWLHEAQAKHMIHGHTHQPAEHALNAQQQRWVLSDWDLDNGAPRAEILRMTLSTTAEKPTHTPLQRLTLQQAVTSLQD